MEYYSNGKLLITGEYVVLDGAMALAVPTKYGQSLEVEPRQDHKIKWESFDEKGESWFRTEFSTDEILGNAREKAEKSSPDFEQKETETRLKQILREAHLLNSDILISGYGFTVTTKLDFPQNWGLGSSSTLINNIAQWFHIDAYKLLEVTFGGSGYDIAAAQTFHPFTYQLGDSKRNILAADFDPHFKEELFFVYLNRKQNSRESVSQYQKQGKVPEENTEKISSLTQSFIHCENLAQFQMLIEIHETLISKLINTPKVKTQLFQDFPGALKSLGGWGGDFILATGNLKAQDYFRRKGYDTIIPYSKMVL
jgi:mevalonate kinase